MPNAATASYRISQLTVRTNSQATKEGSGQFSKGSPHGDRAETSEPSPLQAPTFFQKAALQPALSEKTEIAQAPRLFNQAGKKATLSRNARSLRSFF